ncbi:MAG: YkgJ family cysteine cluster protein [Candidatus Paceibacterota bacterium]
MKALQNRKIGEPVFPPVDLHTISDEQLEDYLDSILQIDGTFFAPFPFQTDHYIAMVLYKLLTDPKVKCKGCGLCCIAPDNLGMTDKDIIRLSDSLGITESRLMYLYRISPVKKSDSDNTFNMKCSPCPFTKDSRCSVYSCRPEICRYYPIISNIIEGVNTHGIYIHEKCARNMELKEFFNQEVRESYACIHDNSKIPSSLLLIDEDYESRVRFLQEYLK